MTPRFEQIRPTDARVAALVESHLSLMIASSPSCSRHAMDAGSLEEAGAHFFVIFHGNDPIAMGALKAISAEHCEIKSMHVVSTARGTGLGRQMLAFLLDEARRLGFAQVSLETGSKDVFAPARAMYERAGFAPCDPIPGYGPDPNSAYFTRTL